MEAQREQAPIASSTETQDANAPLAALFGELWPLPTAIGEVVKLNPEVGREKMGKQLQYLKRRVDDERVWKFEPKAQHWIRIRLDEEAS
ncbi:TPA: DUF3275 family protein [Vibrio parahaemolyticus]|nr:DUF3275 family protein [Vibrio parahaemolyticus]HBB9976758.1 DUF3275 family protein [Vibrio parahaemolyticus]HBC0013357.1 DUF3275 family protein [Vibrio parahaemolyticus]